MEEKSAKLAIRYIEAKNLTPMVNTSAAHPMLNACSKPMPRTVARKNFLLLLLPQNDLSPLIVNTKR